MHIMLERYRAAKRVVLLKNATNLGFIGTVNRGLRFCRDGDVLLLNSDTRLYPGGLAEMHQTLRDAPDIASVTPLSNNATIFSYPHPALAGAALEDVDFAELAQVALKENGGISIDVPTGHGFCLLIRREVLDRLGLLDVVFGRGYGEENEFCARATDLGFRHVAAVGAFVRHHESVSFGSEKLALIETNIERLSRMYPEYIPTIMAYERHDHLRAGRWGLDMFRLRTLRDAGERFALIVDNSLGGGTKKSSADLDAFVGYGDRLVLRLSSGKEGRIHLECDQIKLCAVFLRGEHEELLRVLDAAECDLVIYHQLLGYDAAMIEALGIWSRQRMAVCYLHDFYPICPRATLINAVGDFCGVASADICDRCVHLAGAHENANLDGILVAEHRSIFSSFLTDMTTIIAPSRNAAGYVQQVFPSLSLETIRHPNKAGAYPSSMRDGKLVNVVILGAIGPHKGSRKLLEIASHALLTHPHLNFTVVGYTDIDDELKKLPNMKISGRYKPEELPVILGQLDSSVALFLQVWPETFSYTLSEAVQAGLLPIVPDIGAPAERVRDAGFGIVVPFPIDIKQLLATIDTLDLNALRQCDPRGFDASSSIEVLRKLLS
jgi:GT2 family glycosyltransferase